MKYYAEEAYKVKLTLSQIAILDILSRDKESTMSGMARLAAAPRTGTRRTVGLDRNLRGGGGGTEEPFLGGAFLIPELGLTAAQLPAEEKHRRSHRGIALQHLVERLGIELL